MQLHHISFIFCIFSSKYPYKSICTCRQIYNFTNKSHGILWKYLDVRHTLLIPYFERNDTLFGKNHTLFLNLPLSISWMLKIHMEAFSDFGYVYDYYEVILRWRNVTSLHVKP